MGKKITVMQQVLKPVGSGGVSAEYRALVHSQISKQYVFVPLILEDFHAGINLHDIWFYYRKIKQVKPDIIQVRGAAVDGLNAVIAAKLAGNVAIMVCVHGMYSDLVYIGRLKRWLAGHVVEPLIFSLADGISCVYRKASKRKVFLKYKDKMLPFVYNRLPKYNLSNRQIIRNRVRAELGIPDSNKVGTYCGRITKEKGLHVLLQSLRAMDTDWPERFSLLIVGDGSYLKEFVGEIEKLKFAKSILCIGNKDNVSDYLFASDFFIHPSLHENHSIALLEACAARIPSIATRVGGNDEIVSDQVNGILVNENNAMELKQAIERMINDTKFYQQCVDALINAPFEEFRDSMVDAQLLYAYKCVQRRRTYC